MRGRCVTGETHGVRRAMGFSSLLSPCRCGQAVVNDAAIADCALVPRRSTLRARRSSGCSSALVAVRGRARLGAPARFGIARYALSGVACMAGVSTRPYFYDPRGAHARSRRASCACASKRRPSALAEWLRFFRPNRGRGTGRANRLPVAARARVVGQLGYEARAALTGRTIRGRPAPSVQRVARSSKPFGFYRRVAGIFIGALAE